ncbi:demethylspheroidene O-methyltransferase [Peteryoungia aggregata LMG 23059]|uniref:Demethylspheroidene O-methyltransferase n=1 Tax=Peteryoungia aggregata LMG 23059 TaxID=1368425 RepID=A0ABU0G378_9HYPH|nr:methyltransferase [Peteryoungia aggregata]MDQ0419409.1 demethylspheroidene O-methyltransferase [Peteryoungia aggregata LMG 23059]
MSEGSGSGFKARSIAAPVTAGDPVAATTMQGLAVRWRLWRSRQIASPAFRNLMSRLPLTRWIANRKANHLFRLTTGFVHSQILWLCNETGLFQMLSDKALTTAELAVQCDFPQDRMQLLLEQAERLDLVCRAGPDLWMLADAGAVLAADRGLREMIRHHDILYRDLGDPRPLWREAASETELRHYWAYVRGNRPEDMPDVSVAPYSALMRESQAMLADCLLASHDFGRYTSLLDLGGGEGAFLRAVGERHPALKLQLFDLPAVADRARQHLALSGLADRSRVHAGNFVADPVPGDADCVTLVRILCDHDDDRVRQILTNLRGQLAPGTTVVVAEAMAGPTEGARLAAVYFSAYFRAMGSGRCRSVAEIRDLLHDAGFRNSRHEITTNPLLATIVVAEA